MTAFNITELFFAQAISNSQSMAIIDKNASIRYEDLAIEVDNTAQYFLSKGIGKGDRVMVFVPMSIALYRIVLALFKIGAVAVFLDEWVSKKRMEVCCDIAECKAIIGGFKVTLLAFISKKIRKIPLHLGTKIGKVASAIPIPITNSSDTALVTFTTGSTGVPKAAKRTHGFLLEQFKALETEVSFEQHRICMTTLPIVLFMNLGLGSTSIIAHFNPKKIAQFKAAKEVQQLIKHKINNIIASPYFVNTIAQYVAEHNVQFKDLKKIFTGGAPVFPREAKIITRSFPHTIIKIVYGSTEAEPISSIAAETLLQYQDESYSSGLNVGVPAAVTSVRIITYVDGEIIINNNEQLESMTLENGEMGEIIVAGDHVLDAYYNIPTALNRNKIFINGTCWHRTGDAGFLRNKYLYLTGRCDSIINTEEGTIAPFIVENILQDIDGISIGTIIKMNHSIYYLIALNKGAEEEEVKSTIEKLGYHHDAIIFLDKIPRDPRHHSKIDYNACKALLL